MIDVCDYMEKQILFVILENDEKISFLNDNIVIKDKEGKIKHQSTCYRLFAVFLVGEASLTTGIIQRAKRFNFSILLFTKSFRLYEVIGGNKDSNTILHKVQYEYNGLEIAKKIIENKIINQIFILQSNREKDKDIQEAIRKMKECVSGLKGAQTVQEVMGREGVASKIYFSRHFTNVFWQTRIPRLKIDYINSILDVGYTVLFAFIESILSIYGFDLYCGVLHRMFYMRKSLVCDLVEPFRPIIDQQIKKSINLKQFKEEDCLVQDGKWVLKWEESSKYVTVFLKCLLLYKKEIFIYIQSYYRAFMRRKKIEDFPVFELKNGFDKL